MLTALYECEDKHRADNIARMDRARAVGEKRTSREETKAERERAQRDEAQRVAEYVNWQSAKPQRMRLLTHTRVGYRAAGREEIYSRNCTGYHMLEVSN